MKSDVPIPSRLMNYVTISDNRGEFAAKGHVKCTCGCESFSLLYLGKRGKSPFFPTIGKLKTSIGRRVVLAAKCENCNHTILLFDSMVDGHKNDYHDAQMYVGPYESFACDKCNKNQFAVEIAF